MKTADHHASEGLSCDRAAFCTTRQAAERIGVSHRTVQMWVENGTLQAWKTAGGHRRIANDSIDRLLASRQAAFALAPVRPVRPQATARQEAHARQPALAPATARPIAPARAPRSVLIVDDDPLLLRLYELEISTWGMDLAVRKASNGFEALVRIGEARPDIMLSDLQMPGMDGIGMIRKLRDNPATASMALVVVSGMDQPTSIAMGLPDDVPYFTKPAPLAALRAAVTSALPPAP